MPGRPTFRGGGWRRGIVVFRRRLLSGFDLGGVPGDDAGDAAFEAPLDERLMDAIDEPRLGEFAEGQGKRRLRWDFRAPLPTADAPERGVDEEAFPQGRGRTQAEDSLGDEGAGDGSPVVARAPGAAGLGAHVRLEPDHVERVDQLLEFRGERVDLLTQEGEQIRLDGTPARLRRGNRVLGHDVTPEMNSLYYKHYRPNRQCFCNDLFTKRRYCT